MALLVGSHGHMLKDRSLIRSSLKCLPFSIMSFYQFFYMVTQSTAPQVGGYFSFIYATAWEISGSAISPMLISS